MATRLEVVELATLIANCAQVISELIPEVVGNDTATTVNGAELTQEYITSLVVASINNEFGV